MYCKLFASLYQGTLRGRSDEILVFTNLLAHTSAGGIVDKHFRAVAEETGLSLDRVKQAILVLESPDEESRSPDEKGARLVRLDEHRVWGWRVVNHGKYRAIKNEDDRAEQNRLAQARFRERKKAEANGEKSAIVSGVITSNTDKPKQKHKADADAEASPLSGEGGISPDSVFLSDENDPNLSESWEEWKAYRKERAAAKGKQRLAWTHRAALATAKQVIDYAETRGNKIICDRITAAIAGNWQGLNLDKLEAGRPQAAAPKSYAQQDKERKEAERHGPEVIPIRHAFTYKPQS